MSEICVSVITPTHNMAEFLPETVRSVREQTLSGVEHIVIDDGSTDNTPEIAASFGPDVTFTRVPHGGAARARNIGLSMARGATVMFLDADDVIAPDTLRLLHAALGDARDCIAYGTQFDLLFRDGAWKPGDAPRPFHPPDGDPLRSLLLRQWSVLPCGELWPRSLVDRLGGFDERCAALQDADLLFRALASGVRLLPVPGAVSHYCRHEGARTSISQSHHRPEVFESRIHVVGKLTEEMKRLGIFETYRIPVARFYYGLAVTHFPHHAVRAVECAEHAWNLAGWDSMPFSRTRRLLCRAVGFANYRRLARVIGSG